MKNIKILFNHRLTVLSNLFVAASLQDNPALWLYQNNARTELFYLEAICRLLANFHNKKRLTKLTEQFKHLEDALGLVDYYDAFIKEFSNNKAISTDVIEYLTQQRQVALLKLNQHLYNKDWVGESAQRILKIRDGKGSKKIDWLSDDELVSKLGQFYAQKTAEITSELSKPLQSIENDLHELRRDVRWLSIYPQALKGFIVLAKARAIVAKKFDKYLTPEIINSPFNQLPSVDDITAPLKLNPNCFLAMSWFIDAAGKLKDQGLRLDALTHAIHSTQKIAPEAAEKLAMDALGHQQASIEEILNAGQIVAKQILADGIFDGLLAV